MWQAPAQGGRSQPRGSLSVCLSVSGPEPRPFWWFLQWRRWCSFTPCKHVVFALFEMRRISYHPMAEVAKTQGKHRHLRNHSKTHTKHEVSHGRKRCVLLACSDVSQKGGKVEQCSMAPNAYRIRVEGGWDVLWTSMFSETFIFPREMTRFWGNGRKLLFTKRPRWQKP